MGMGRLVALIFYISVETKTYCKHISSIATIQMFVGDTDQGVRVVALPDRLVDLEIIEVRTAGFDV